MVARIGDIERARAVDENPRRAVKPCVRARAIRRTRHAGAASEGRHHAGGCHAADRVVTGVGDVGVTRSIHRDGLRTPQARAGRRGIEVARSGADERRHAAVGGDPADGGVARIGHVERAVGLRGQRRGEIEQGHGTGAIRRTCARGDAGPGGNGAGGEHEAAHRVVAGVGDVEIARAIECEGLGHVETRGGTRAVRRARLAGGAGQCRHHARRRDAADRVVARIGHVEIARAVERQPGWIVETRGRAGAVGAAGETLVAREHRERRAGHREAADDVVATVAEVERLPVAGDGDTAGRIERGAKLGDPKRRHHAGRSDLADGEREDVEGVEVARAVGGEVLRCGETRGRARTIEHAHRAGQTGESRDRARRRAQAHGGVASVGDEEIARSVERDAGRAGEARGGAVFRAQVRAADPGRELHAHLLGGGRERAGAGPAGQSEHGADEAAGKKSGDKHGRRSEGQRLGTAAAGNTSTRVS
ncbi:MAG: hypothetical protein BWX86_02093 [Verrucomicrobia bacterium ADurb.Bin122]|nr:MAG: hypothetical protein BWX86_02093 [Verrucomicrobia bacterium ADurb.Bin122]